MVKLRVGDVYRVYDFPIYPPKGKLAVLVCITPEEFFLINSESRPMYDPLPIQPEGRAFLNQPSSIGCKNLFSADGTTIDKRVGRLTDDEIRALILKVKSSRTLTGVQKSRIVSALSAELSSR